MAVIFLSLLTSPLPITPSAVWHNQGHSKRPSQPSPEAPQRKHKNKGILKSSQLPKETASRKTAPFRMLTFQCIFLKPPCNCLIPPPPFISAGIEQRDPTAPQDTPGLTSIPDAIQAHRHSLCGTAAAVTSFPPSVLTRKWLTHMFHVSIYQQIISPVFWDPVTGPISCELPNNVYNQLLMALCYSVRVGPLVSVSAAPTWLRHGFRDAACFHLWWFPHRWEVGGCLPKLHIPATWCPFIDFVWDSYGKQAYGCLSYKWKQYAIWNDKTQSRSK